MAEDMSQLINKFKNMLNMDNSNSTESSESSKVNISPDMLNNILNNLKDNINNNSSKDDKNVNADVSSNSNESSSQIDFDTLLKIKSVMESLNKKDDPRSKLLYSLKPYLRENRQKKMDEYINLLKISSITNLFKKNKEN